MSEIFREERQYYNPGTPINDPSAPLLRPPCVSQHGLAGWQLRCGDDGSTKKGAGARFPTRPTGRRPEFAKGPRNFMFVLFLGIV